MTSMSSGRDAMGVAVLGDRLFIVGGFDGQAYLNVVEAFDPLTNLWTQVIFSFFNYSKIFSITFCIIIAVCSVTVGTCWSLYRSR